MLANLMFLRRKVRELKRSSAEVLLYIEVDRETRKRHLGAEKADHTVTGAV